MCAATATPLGQNGESILVIFGSPHAHGATAQLTNRLLADTPPARITRFDCFAAPPLPCDDCRFCHTEDGCSKPDLQAFYAALEQADVLVFATPVYHCSFPSPLKALIDRLQRYWSARFIRGIRPPIARPKRALLLTASGGTDIREAQLLEAQLRPPLTILNATLTGVLHVLGADGDIDWSVYADSLEALKKQ